MKGLLMERVYLYYKNDTQQLEKEVKLKKDIIKKILSPFSQFVSYDENKGLQKVESGGDRNFCSTEKCLIF